MPLVELLEPMGRKILAWCEQSRLLRFGRLVCLVFVAGGLVGCDHATKFAAKANLEGAPALPVAPGLLHGTVSLHYVQNDDIAFNAFRMLGVPRSPLILAVVGSIAILSIAIMLLSRRMRGQLDAITAMKRSNAERNWGLERSPNEIGIALVFGGALGNLVDRIARGYVIDFIHVKGWPVFNVADIAVVAGMILMALPHLRRLRRSRRASGPAD